MPRDRKGQPVWQDIGGGMGAWGVSDDGRWLVKLGKNTYQVGGEDGGKNVTGTSGAYLRGGGSDDSVRGMVQEAMRTAKDGGLIRGAGVAVKGRGRGKMV